MTDDNGLLRREIASLGQKVIELRLAMVAAEELVRTERAKCADIARRMGDEEVADAIEAQEEKS